MEDRLLMLLMDYREHRTFAHVGASFGLGEARWWRVVIEPERRLLQDRRFHLECKQRRPSETAW